MVKLNIKKILLWGLAGLGILFIGAVVLIAYLITKVDKQYTGQDLFDAVNEHRKSVGVQELRLDENLCDNLVERWLAVKEPNNGHRGFEEWAEGEGLTKDHIAVEPYKTTTGITELYIQNATQTYWAIDAWVGSPGHRAKLEKPELNSGCAYAHEGTGVVIMAEK